MGYRLADGSLSTDYKVGDKVKIRKDSKYYGANVKNPSNAIGFVVSVDDDLLPVLVDWGNGVTNNYNHSDLELPEFTKSDLKDGMRVELRDGCVHYVCGAEGYCPGDGSTVDLTEYSEDFNNTGSGDEKFDIIRVTDRDGTVLFEREGEPEKVKLELEVTPEQAEAIRKQLGR